MGAETMIEFVPPPSPTAASLPPAMELGSFSKRQQLLQKLLKDSELLLKNRLEVRHLMTRDPVVVPATMTLEEMTALVQQRRLHHLLVCGRGGELLGVISDRDLHASPGTTARQLMSHPPLTVTPETPLSPAITYLMNENISCLPVMAHGRLCGVLTTTDLVLTLQCSLQLWLRLAQVLQHNTTWTKELDQIAASLDGDLTAQQLAEPACPGPPGDAPTGARPGQPDRSPRGRADRDEQPAGAGRNPRPAAGDEEALRTAVFAGHRGDRSFPSHYRVLRR